MDVEWIEAARLDWAVWADLFFLFFYLKDTRGWFLCDVDWTSEIRFSARLWLNVTARFSANQRCWMRFFFFLRQTRAIENAIVSEASNLNVPSWIRIFADRIRRRRLTIRVKIQGSWARLKGRFSISQGCDNFQRRLYRWMMYPPGVFSPWVLGCVSLPGNDTLEVRALIGPVSLFLS